MRKLERTVKIASIQRLNEKVRLNLTIVEPDLVPPKAVKPEDYIETIPKSETEKMSREMAKGLVSELEKHGMVPTQLTQLTQPTQPTQIQTSIPSFAAFSILLTREEYEKLGSPTVFDEFKLRLERKKSE